MKKVFIKIVIALVVIIPLIFLYLVLAVNIKIKEHEKFRNLQPDSIRINDSTYYPPNGNSKKLGEFWSMRSVVPDSKKLLNKEK